jgi:hypothetical protein
MESVKVNFNPKSKQQMRSPQEIIEVTEQAVAKRLINERFAFFRH